MTDKAGGGGNSSSDSTAHEFESDVMQPQLQQMVNTSQVDVEMGADGDPTKLTLPPSSGKGGMQALTVATGAADPDSAPCASSKLRKGMALLLVVAAVSIVGVGVGVGLGLGRKPGGEGGGHEEIYSVVSLDSAVAGRTYFIAADKVAWNYAPSGKNLCYDNETAAKMLPAGFTRVGGIFTKAQYREYTDSSFSTLKPIPPEWAHLGNMGPPIRASVGDVVRIVFRNNLPRGVGVNMVPSGGLVPWDGSGRISTRVAPVAPGGTVTYLWLVSPQAGPVPNATVTSRLWLYSSSVDPSLHDNAGLVGPIIVTAAGGELAADGRPADVDREVVVIFQVVNERLSAVSLYGNSALANGVSYTKMSMNGYTWCNMPRSALTLSVGERVRWHVASVGSGDSLHNYHWHGHTVELNGHHMDQFTAIPGATYSVNMVPDEPGSWMFHCHVNFHMDGGMVNLYHVEGQAAATTGGGIERMYFVAAEQVEWSYSGESNTQMCGDEPGIFGEDMDGYQFVNGPWIRDVASGGNSTVQEVRLGYKLSKTLFREYTDASFTTLMKRSLGEDYLGFVGPIFRAVVGDTLKIVLFNRSPYNVSMHPHGVRYSKAHEGTLYEDGTTGTQKLDDIVQPGTDYTYIWHVTERSGPGPADPSSLLWMYHGHLDETAETYAGLMGGIIVTSPALADMPISPMPQPTDVDREVVIFFMVTDEIKSSNFMENLRTRLGDGGALAANKTAVAALVEDAGFQEHMLKHGINGYMYCNMPKLWFLQGDKVRMHVMVLGTLEDMHSPNMGGPRFEYNQQRMDSVQMSPGGMVSADVIMTSPGEFELQCRVADHVASGMRAKYEVLPRPDLVLTTPPTGRTRKYYIQAEPVSWNYAPEGYKCSGDLVDTNTLVDSFKYIMKTSYTMGSKFRKAVFRSYTDKTFTVRIEQPSYYGTMGPTLIVEVGDVLEVYLKNNLMDLDYPINIQAGGGLLVLRDTGTDDGEMHCTEVAAGASCLYRWLIPSSAGPGAGDLSTTVYGYTSTVDVATAPSAGLAGALVVAEAGTLQPSKVVPQQEVPPGVDLMIPLYWQVVNEEMSPYWNINKALLKINETAIDRNSVLSPTFHEGNLKHSINGFIYCNLPDLAFKSGATVRWLLVAYGTEGDMHSPYFMGQTTQVDRNGFNTMALLMPSIARPIDMKAVTTGKWLLSCSVHDHYTAGMVAHFVVA